MASNPGVKLTEDEYLAIERAAEFKSEFIGGEMFAMSGGSPRHSKLQWNLVLELGGAIRGKGCTGFGSDMRVRVSAALYTYPDISVVCGTHRYADGESESLLNPTVIVEVLSPSTEKYRQADGTWMFRDYQKREDELNVESIEVSIPLARIYENVL